MIINIAEYPEPDLPFCVGKGIMMQNHFKGGFLLCLPICLQTGYFRMSAGL